MAPPSQELEPPANPERFKIPPGEADLRIADGHPARVVGDVIGATDADLLVLGTRGESGLKRFLMGSVADRLLRTIEIDILAVPPGD